MQIKTLAEILGETEEKHNQKPRTKRNKDNSQSKLSSKPTSKLSSNRQHNSPTTSAHTSSKAANRFNSNNRSNSNNSNEYRHQGNKPPLCKSKNRPKKFHPASTYQPNKTNTTPQKELDTNSIKSILSQINSASHAKLPSDTNIDKETVTSTANLTHTKNINDNSCNEILAKSDAIDNLPAALKAYLKTPEQRQAELEEIKANSRLRWLAFYYLSRREHSAAELKQKLIAKDQDPNKIDELLNEFSEKGYQSDYRTAMMLIREGIRKKRGRTRIKQDFYQRKVDVPANIDELIDMAMQDSEDFADLVSDDALIEGVDWLKLAVEARVKKYGNTLPTDNKQKARQLRFLQYRGFKPHICIDALKYTTDTLEDRF